MEFNVIRSKRRTISIKINIDLSITVRVPLHISRAEIERILKKKEYWINKRMTEINDIIHNKDIKEEIRRLAQDFLL